MSADDILAPKCPECGWIRGQHRPPDDPPGACSRWEPDPEEIP